MLSLVRAKVLLVVRVVSPGSVAGFGMCSRQLSGDRFSCDTGLMMLILVLMWHFVLILI